MLLQSMLQSLVLMMLMRNCVVLFGYTQGVVALILMCPRPSHHYHPNPNPNPTPTPSPSPSRKPQP